MTVSELLLQFTPSLQKRQNKIKTSCIISRLKEKILDIKYQNNVSPNINKLFTYCDYSGNKGYEKFSAISFLDHDN